MMFRVLRPFTDALGFTRSKTLEDMDERRRREERDRQDQRRDEEERARRIMAQKEDKKDGRS